MDGCGVKGRRKIFRFCGTGAEGPPSLRVDPKGSQPPPPSPQSSLGVYKGCERSRVTRASGEEGVSDQVWGGFASRLIISSVQYEMSPAQPDSHRILQKHATPPSNCGSRCIYARTYVRMYVCTPKSPPAITTSHLRTHIAGSNHSTSSLFLCSLSFPSSLSFLQLPTNTAQPTPPTPPAPPHAPRANASRTRPQHPPPQRPRPASPRRSRPPPAPDSPSGSCAISACAYRARTAAAPRPPGRTRPGARRRRRRLWRRS